MSSLPGTLPAISAKLITATVKSTVKNSFLLIRTPLTGAPSFYIIFHFISFFNVKVKFISAFWFLLNFDTIIWYNERDYGRK